MYQRMGKHLQAEPARGSAEKHVHDECEDWILKLRRFKQGREGTQN